MTWTEAFPAVAVLGGAVIGGGVSVLATLMANAHRERLDSAARRDAFQAERRTEVRGAYEQLIRCLFDVMTSLGFGGDEIEPDFSPDEWKEMIVSVHMFGSTDVRESMEELAGLLSRAVNCRAAWVDARKSPRDFERDERTEIRLSNQAATSDLREHAKRLIERVNAEITGLADFSRTDDAK